MKKLVHWFQNHKLSAAAFILLTFVFLACCAFPFYNLTKPFSGALTFTNLFVNFSVYGYIGAFMARFQPHAGIRKVVLMNLAVILGGMLCRWLLEFGEVSNTYNFTPSNIALHLLVTVTISTWSWCRTSKKTK